VSTEEKKCFWCGKQCGGNCLGVNDNGASKQMTPEDPAYWMLSDGHTTTPTAYKAGCYICEDPEYAQMGMSLCGYCPKCSEKAGEPAGHVPADDTTCDTPGCTYDVCAAYEAEQALKEAAVKPGYPPVAIDNAGPDTKPWTPPPAGTTTTVSLDDALARLQAKIEES
jgi:hypothetical protein